LLGNPCPICVDSSIGVPEKIAAGLGGEVRCKQCGGSVRVHWPTRWGRAWTQGIALTAGLLLSFFWLSPIPFGAALAIMLLAPAFLSVVPNKRDPLTAKLISHRPDQRDD